VECANIPVCVFDDLLRKEVFVRNFITLAVAAVLVACVVESVEAANRLWTIRSSVPKVVNTATKSFGKIGDGVSSFLWRNKGAITTGTVLVTAATNPEPFIDGVVAVANGPPILIQDGDRTVALKTSANWGGYIVLGSLACMVGLIVLYEAGGKLRTIAKIATALLISVALFWLGVIGADILIGLIALLTAIVLWTLRTDPKIVTAVLLIGFVIAGCGVACADDFGTIFDPTCVAPFGWNRIIDIVLIIVMLFLPFA